MIRPYLTERTTNKYHLLLDANEHYKQWVALPVDLLNDLNRYPDRHATELRETLASVYAKPFTADNILVTAGSIEAIDLLLLALSPKNLLVNVPGYDVYEQRASVHNVPVTRLPFDDKGQPDSAAILSSGQEGSLLILISPNNPTGRLVDRSIAQGIIESFKGIVVIDEAYIEYAGMENSLQDFVLTHPNVIVLRTFSKAWGLAGVRLGYLIANPAIVQRLAQHQNTYSVSRFATQAGICALNQVHGLQKQVDETLENKYQLFEKLKRSGIKVTDTSANFLLLELADIDNIHKGLQKKGILVRPRPLVHGQRDCLRLTIGSSTDNELFYRALMDVLYDS